MIETRMLMLLATLLLAACGSGDQEAAGSALAVQPASAATSASAAVVDSIFPMNVMIARFQAEAGRPSADAWADAATSRDDLVAQFVRAVEDDSRSALQSLRLDRAGYAHHYFPDSHLARDPYRQPPAIAWLLTEQNGLKAEARLLRYFGGRPLGFDGYECAAEPLREGENTLWRGCVVRTGARDQPMRLFGTILERSGRFKFISMANDL